MFWNKYFFPSIIVMLLVVAFHWLGSLQDLYSTVDWYDIPMHFFGGVWVALFALWAIGTQYGTFFKKYLSVSSLLLWVLFVGVSWEVLELALKFNSIDDMGYAFDTTFDIILDMLGAAAVVSIYKNNI